MVSPLGYCPRIYPIRRISCWFVLLLGVCGVSPPTRCRRIFTSKIQLFSGSILGLHFYRFVMDFGPLLAPFWLHVRSIFHLFRITFSSMFFNGFLLDFWWILCRFSMILGYFFWSFLEFVDLLKTSLSLSKSKVFRGLTSSFFMVFRIIFALVFASLFPLIFHLF